jgi:hypothetical protein
MTIPALRRLETQSEARKSAQRRPFTEDKGNPLQTLGFVRARCGEIRVIRSVVPQRLHGWSNEYTILFTGHHTSLPYDTLTAFSNWEKGAGVPQQIQTLQGPAV